MNRWTALLLGALVSAASAQNAPPPPIAMTDPDGQALRLERLDVRVAAHGPLALTELEMTFRNPEPYVVEGKFSCMLPPGATLSRFARELDGKWMEGEVVERKRAQRAYSAAISSGSGGSLLQRVSGTRFKAKVFPVYARSVVKLILSYTTSNPLDSTGQRRLTVPLVGLTEISEFRFRAVCRPLPGERVVMEGWLGTPRTEAIGGQTVFSETISRTRFAPATNLVFRFEPSEWSKHATRIRAGDFVLTTLRPRKVRTADESEPDEWHLLVDTSASFGMAPANRIAVATELAKALEEGGARRTSLVLSAFDLEVVPLFRFRAGEGRSGELKGLLETRGFLGATDLGAALEHVGKLARQDERERTFVLVTDAVPSQGDLELAELMKRLGEIPAGSKIHLVTLGGQRDAAVSQAIVDKGHGRIVDVPLTFDAAGEAVKAAAELRRVPGVDYEVRDSGAEWIYPTKVRDVAPGQELVFFSRLKSGQESRLELVGTDGESITPTDEPFRVPAFEPLLEREAYRARIAGLKQQESTTYSYEEMQKLRQEQIDLSVKHRVLCSYTSLLVLNFEEDYERYGIERNALAEILVVGENGVALQGRSSQDLATMTRQEWDEAKAAQKPKNFPAGRDPLIKVRAPEDTKRIVALFPWGETKLLELDKRDGFWKARFVIPRWLAHGKYRVVLVLTRGDGRKQRMVVSFGADRASPKGGGAGRVWKTSDGWRVKLAVEGSADTLRAVAKLPSGELKDLTAGETAGSFELVFDLKVSPGPSFLVPITLFDGAHNQITVEVEVELK